MTRPSSELIRIAVVAFDRISPFHLSVPSIVFSEGLRSGRHFELAVCSAENKQRLTTLAGYDIVVKQSLAWLDTADIIIVPSWRNPDEPAPKRLLEHLVSAHQRGAQIVGLCLGAYILAQAGLLNGQKATTHWAYADDFANRYPQVRLDPDVLYVEDGLIMTSAGTAAGIDCCLQMLRSRLGAEQANSAARRMVVAPHRQGGQGQFIDRPLPISAQDSRFVALLQEVRASLHLAHNIDGLAAQALMSRRTFTRHFRSATGTTLSAWLLHERLILSQQLLENTDLYIEQIARQVGFGSAISMRQHFRKAFGVSPMAWRQTFRLS